MKFLKNRLSALTLTLCLAAPALHGMEAKTQKDLLVQLLSAIQDNDRKTVSSLVEAAVSNPGDPRILDFNAPVGPENQLPILYVLSEANVQYLQQEIVPLVSTLIQDVHTPASLKTIYNFVQSALDRLEAFKLTHKQELAALGMFSDKVKKAKLQERLDDIKNLQSIYTDILTVIKLQQAASK